MKRHPVGMAAVLALLAFAPATARANDCEANAAKAVNELGATVESRDSALIALNHDAAPGGITMKCGEDGADLFMNWGTPEPPSGSFFSLAGAMGFIVTGIRSKAFEAAVRACFDAAHQDKVHGSADFNRGAIRFWCMSGAADSFRFTAERREALK